MVVDERNCCISGKDEIGFISLNPADTERNPCTCGCSTDKQRIGPTSLLCYAVSDGDNTLVEKLIKYYPASVNDLCEIGLSPLHLAAVDGNICIIKMFLECNARINMLDRHGRTVLEHAVSAGQFDCARYLIEAGADLTLVKDGMKF